MRTRFAVALLAATIGADEDLWFLRSGVTVSDLDGVVY